MQQLHFQGLQCTTSTTNVFDFVLVEIHGEFNKIPHGYSFPYDGYNLWSKYIKFDLKIVVMHGFLNRGSTRYRVKGILEGLI